MSLLTICNALAKNVGMAATDVVMTSPYRQWAEAVQFANETGEELARRVDWGQLQESITLTGNSTNLTHSLPVTFSRFNAGASVFAGTSIVRPLSRQEWSRLTPTVGTPRYFLLEGRDVTFWPYLASAATVTGQYQSKAWCSNGTDAFTADNETSLIDETLFAKALAVRWRRQKGMDYADLEAEVEAMIEDLARFNDRSRL